MPGGTVIDVASNQNLSGQSNTNFACAAQNVQAGKLLAVGFQMTSASGDTIASVTDTAGNTYVKLAAETHPTVTTRVELWIAENVTANAANVTTLHAASGGGNYWSVVVVQYDQVTAGVGVTGAAGHGNSSTASTSSFSTAQATELILACLVNFNSNGWTAGSNYTLDDSGTPLSNTYVMIESWLTSSTQTGVVADGTAGASFFWAAVAGSLKIGSAPSGRIWVVAGQGGGLVGPARGLAGRQARPVPRADSWQRQSHLWVPRTQEVTRPHV